MPEDYQELLTCAVEAAKAASATLRLGYGKSFTISTKTNRHDLVTEYDKKAEEIIITTIKKKYPHHAFLGEEGGYHPGKSQGKSQEDPITWVIDPLDGTVNFAHGIPIFSVSIAACRGDTTYCGVVIHPLLDEVFTAGLGMGAYLNGNPIHTSKTKDLNGAFLATGFPYNIQENPKACIDQFGLIAKKGMPIRRLGSAALDLCYVASGRFDAYWEVTLQPWDLAAGQLIVQEAGGIVTNYQGIPRSYITTEEVLATNGPLHSQMVQILSKDPI